jgi:menaquinone-dependent protoporphyrinogen oxidase
MKIIILYMSHLGTVRKVAEEMQQDLGADRTTLVDLGAEDAPSLEGFDTVIIGGSIHVGNIQSKIQKYCAHHEKELLQKRLGLFVCFMDKDYGQKEFDEAFSEPLRLHSKVNGLFGGEFLVDKMNFVERLMVKMKTGVTNNVSALREGAIETFENVIRNED